ncbi:MAG: hypothetical protein JW902_15105 [Syntrophaceae bacterium]|nr:hypothetical protein [Syntrophaceae bacterium]
MKQKLICPVCGYVTTEDRLGKVCPACGVKRRVFKPFEDRISEKRRTFLNLKLHPMMVHFPQALPLVVFALLAFSLVVSSPLQANARVAARILMVLLPLAVLAGMIPGVLDGKIRFRRLDVPFLKTKLLVSIIFFAAALALALMVLLNCGSGIWLYLVLSGLCSMCALVLGNIGGKLGCLLVGG